MHEVSYRARQFVISGVFYRWREHGCRCVTFLRFGAGPGCGGPPHCTVLLCRSRSRSLVNDLRHTSQTKGVGLQPLACRCKFGRRVNARPHVADLCIVADTRRDPTTARCVSGGRLLLVDWHRRKSPDCTSAKWHSKLNHETIWMCFRCAPHCVHHDSTSFLHCALHAGRTALIG